MLPGRSFCGTHTHTYMRIHGCCQASAQSQLATYACGASARSPKTTVRATESEKERESMREQHSAALRFGQASWARILVRCAYSALSLSLATCVLGVRWSCSKCSAPYSSTLVHGPQKALEAIVGFGLCRPVGGTVRRLTSSASSGKDRRTNTCASGSEQTGPRQPSDFGTLSAATLSASSINQWCLCVCDVCV